MSESSVTEVAAGTHKKLFGKMFKVTQCDADPEFVAKVARIREDLSSKSNAPQITEQSGGMVAFQEEDDIETEVAPEVSSELQDEATVEQLVDVEADGSCMSSPKKPKLKNKTKPPVEKVPAEEDINKILEKKITFDKMNSSKTVDNSENDPGLSDDEEFLPTYEKAVSPNVEKGYSSQETLAEDEEPEDEEFDDAHDGLPPSTEENLRSQPPISVSNRKNLLEYSESEWKGETLFAQQMRHGYSKIVEIIGCRGMRKIRGDNYCGLRATCFQVLSQSLNVLNDWNEIDDIQLIPQKLIQNHGCNWLVQWSFAGRLKVSQKKKIDTMIQCLKCFSTELKNSKTIEDDSTRIQHFLKYFNSGNLDEVLLFEASKLLMLYTAVLIHEAIQTGKEFPMFGALMFARDTSENPEQLMKHHLNTVGDTGGLEQVEMYLLGYALKLRIRVARPSQAEQEDFMTYYPEDHEEDWDTCNLIAEDDRHYNIIVP